MDRKVFYDFVRNIPFGGRISPDQFSGLEHILNYKEKNYPDMDVRWLAYILATTYHETARTMQPVRETQATSDAQAIARLDTAFKKGQLKGVSKPYWREGAFGRGLVQITHAANYAKFGIKDYAQALEWPTALRVLFDGMINAKFTKYRLSQFFNKTNDDPKGARKIVNGTDKASLIAEYHKNFLDALKQAEKAVEAPEEVRAPEPKADKPDAPTLSQDPMTQIVTGIGGVGALSSLVSAVSNPWALGAVFLIAVGVGVFLYLRKQQSNAIGV